MTGGESGASPIEGRRRRTRCGAVLVATALISSRPSCAADPPPGPRAALSAAQRAGLDEFPASEPVSVPVVDGDVSGTSVAAAVVAGALAGCAPPPPADDAAMAGWTQGHVDVRGADIATVTCRRR